MYITMYNMLILSPHYLIHVLCYRLIHTLLGIPLKTLKTITHMVKKIYFIDYNSECHLLND
jgi:hypothetical protein